MPARSFEDALRTFIERAERIAPLRAVVLFGSRARGEALDTSDYDLAVVSDAFAGMRRLGRADLLAELWGGVPVAEIHGFTPEEIMALDRPFLWEIAADAVALHGNEFVRELRSRLDARIRAGVLERTRSGWRFDPVRA